MKIMIIGGDKRNLYLTRRLNEKGHDAEWYCAEKYDGTHKGVQNFKSDIDSFDAVILPLPLTKDGETLNCPYSDKQITLAEVGAYIKDKIVFTSDGRISGKNYFSDKGVIVDNARLTAVGFLSELLAFETGDIMGKKALVTGFGNVAKCVCKILSDNGVSVFTAARNSVQRHEAAACGCSAMDFGEAGKRISEFDYIVNTVPEKVFSDSVLAKIGAETVYFELASGVPKETEKYRFAYIECRGMPGKHTPKGAGEVIADFVCSELKE